MEKKDLKPAGVFKYFEEICQVPRPSKKEEKMIAYLKAFGAKHNLETKVDEAGNVLIKKPATPGKENLQTVVLQSHIDMVCEKNNEFGVLKVKNLKGGLDFTQLTNEEIDLQLTKYFRTHPFMRRHDFQYLCGMARSTAMRHIRRLRDEGKLKNMGGAMQPIYVPGSGYYGKNKEVSVKTE